MINHSKSNLLLSFYRLFVRSLAVSFVLCWCSLRSQLMHRCSSANKTKRQINEETEIGNVILMIEYAICNIQIANETEMHGIYQRLLIQTNERWQLPKLCQFSHHFERPSISIMSIYFPIFFFTFVHKIFPHWNLLLEWAHVRSCLHALIETNVERVHANTPFLNYNDNNKSE